MHTAGTYRTTPAYLDGAESGVQGGRGRLLPGIHHGCQPAVLHILPGTWKHNTVTRRQIPQVSRGCSLGFNPAGRQSNACPQEKQQHWSWGLIPIGNPSSAQCGEALPVLGRGTGYAPPTQGWLQWGVWTWQGACGMCPNGVNGTCPTGACEMCPKDAFRMQVMGGGRAQVLSALTLGGSRGRGAALPARQLSTTWPPRRCCSWSLAGEPCPACRCRLQS